MAVAPIKKGGRMRRYPDVVATEEAKRKGNGVAPGVMPSWDNSARSPTSAQIYHGSTPALFKQWLGHAVQRAQTNPANERMVFINAWNEWGEGHMSNPI